jgi:hypothetical protein
MCNWVRGEGVRVQISNLDMLDQDLLTNLIKSLHQVHFSSMVDN